MKKIIAAMLFLTLLLTSCGDDASETTEFTEPSETASETSHITTEAVITTMPPETTEAVITEPLDISDAYSVEDYYGGDVVYKADFDGDGTDEACTVKVVGHGTQCYVEEIVIERQNGETIEIEHPSTATVGRTDFYKHDERYDLYFGGSFVEYSFKFSDLATPVEHLTELGFGDIFDYTVVGDKLCFRGSVACGMSEVIGEIIYEYTYSDGALKVCHMWFKDIINDKEFDIGAITPTTSLLVAPASYKIVSSLPAPTEDALLEGGPVGGLPRFYTFEKGLTYYVSELGSNVDITLRKYSKCELDVPNGYTDAEIVKLEGGGGSGEAFITVRANRDGKTVYLEYYFYCDVVTTPEFVRELDYVPEL